ncbi:MAG: hypothetical protein R6U21_05180 [Thermoplasmatota archaeon]
MEEKADISIKRATEELLETSIFKNVSRRNSPDFAKKLAIWLVRYILIISSMKESLRTNLENILLNLHGDRFKKIVSITEKTFHSVKHQDTEKYNHYIW